MKKILVVACLSTALLHGMEPIQRYNNYCFYYKNTNIYITTRSLFEVNRDVNCIVVGYHEQNMFIKDKFHKKYVQPEGNVFNASGCDIRQKNKEYGYSFTTTNNIVLKAVEPRVVQEKSSQHKKSKKTKCNNTTSNTIPIVSEDTKAILDGCYRRSLHLCLMIHDEQEEIEDKKDIKSHWFSKEKNIAFANLGVAVGFPRKEAATIAVTSIRKFITKYPKVYDKICFIVETQDELDLYRKLFEEEEQEKMILRVYYRRLLEKQAWDKIFLIVYHGPQDEKSVFSWLPREIIMKILYLIP
jgi:hypothetical protein